VEEAERVPAQLVAEGSYPKKRQRIRTIYPGFSMRMSMVSGIPRKHAHALQRLYSLAFSCGTFAYAKDQASLPLDGLLRKTRHHAPMTYLGSTMPIVPDSLGNHSPSLITPCRVAQAVLGCSLHKSSSLRKESVREMSICHQRL
jgi:hypothetical protein